MPFLGAWEKSRTLWCEPLWRREVFPVELFCLKARVTQWSSFPRLARMTAIRRLG